MTKDTDCPLGSAIVRFGEHAFPGGDPVLVAPEFTRGSDGVTQQFLGHSDVHSGVE
jgi:hypothetical protein